MSKLFIIAVKKLKCTSNFKKILRIDYLLKFYAMCKATYQRIYEKYFFILKKIYYKNLRQYPNSSATL